MAVVGRYALAIAWIAAALGLALPLRNAIDPTILFLAAVAIATWSGGWRAGLLAAGLATIAVDYFFVSPERSLTIATSGLPRVGVFLACALAVSWASDARRVTVERALRDSERQLHALFDEAAVGIALVNPAGHAFKVNRKLQTMFGYDEREFRGFSFSRIMHHERAEADWNLFTELVNGKRESYSLDKQCFAKNGRLVWGSLTVSLVRHERGAPMFGIVVVDDVTDKKRAEEALKRSEAFLAEGQRLTRTGSWGWNVPGRKVFFSREALRILGLSAEEPEPGVAALRRCVHPEDVDAVERMVDSAIRSRNDYAMDVRLLLADGSTVYTHVVGRATVNALGESEYMGVVVDLGTE